MRILVNAGELAPVGGVEQSTFQVSRELHARGHTISALYRETGSSYDDWRSITETLVQVPSFACTTQSPLRDLMKLPPALRAAVPTRPDVLWLNRAEQFVWGVSASRLCRVPLVVQLRTHLPFPGVKVAWRAASQFIAVSQFIKDKWISAGVDPDRITVINNGFEAAEYPYAGMDERSRRRAELGLPQDGNVVLYFGRISEAKGLHTLLEAWRQLDRGPDDRLLMVGDPGDDEERAYEARIKATQPDGVVWLPARRDVLSVLHAADTVVLPAHWQEAFGRVTIEAMATGRPVIGTRVGGVPEILSGEFADFLVPPADDKALAATMAKLADWRSRDPGLAQRCTDHVHRNFDLKTIVDRIEGVLGTYARPRPAVRLPLRAAA
ncbi:glycosyltransferase family 4 protein [Nakamurella sp.]|uniref:glycosyltransferase family 4 protein n=1 Tax=Nakamurella sp. TaxID=1869182 RepID=UPI003B3B0B2D